ncbi:hypothetical protein [Streptomyces phaeochromogenes]|uniref:hypothetical protein n=1 Tax=Streptomyces phaeochromogenes TaxID=1923 RepID=UPI000B12C0FC|nr:hypothetical protein [Streptomyces phaeochromogenes]
MALSLDPEIAEVLAPMAGAMADATPPAVGDIAARRAMWEPIIGAAGTAQPIPADVKTSEYYTTAGDGTHITMRWYVKDGARPGPAVLFFHGGGYIFGHMTCSTARSPATCPQAACRCCRSSTAAPPSTPSRHRSKTPTQR